ncbi:hypothetical protein Sa4125_03580 [Aureimonas sp. SA4125]|uniref:hypothetical protein n=1 Tax=Aureimonas sp. SA4125 TaxID=2826993 RepID=UPI001CC7FDDF|nr:hypothetical protein [Aureimonas sp. SA4125]BDA82816.1 hypothetical protein Sa4125_03580 [Aureimonas sp. SA4125]
MKLRKTRIATSGIGAAAMAVALSGCVGPTYGTGKTAGEQLIGDLDGMLSLGSRNDEAKAISYAPRAELVKPSDTSILPPPRDGVSAENDPNWPESPEVRSARIKAAADARNSRSDVISADVALSDKEGITSEQMAANTQTVKPFVNDRAKTTLSPEELDSSRSAFQARLRESKQGSPTTRKYLSEPPVAYRQPSASAPVGDPGVDERVKEARIKGNDESIGTKLRNLLPF